MAPGSPLAPGSDLRATFEDGVALFNRGQPFHAQLRDLFIHNPLLLIDLSHTQSD